VTTQFIVLLLGIAASITLVISALSVHRYRLLIFSVATGIIVSLQYGLVGAYAGLAVTSIGVLRTLMVVGSFKRPWLNHWSFIPVFLILHTIAFCMVTDWSHATWVSFIPLIGGWGGTIVVYFENVVIMKSILIGLGLMWLMYEFNNAMYSQMVGESLNLVSNCVALAILVIAHRRGIPDSEIEDIDTQMIEVITTSIPIIHDQLEKAFTGSINVIHPDAHYKHPKAVRGAHGASVGYARLLEEQDAREKETANKK
jgi:hypothetical protein